MLMTTILSAIIFQYLWQSGNAQSKKHIVFAMFDDLGWSDISALNGEFPTPYIDAMYNDGIILERHYIHYLCSPSRSQFLSGRRSSNLGYGQLKPWGYTQIGAIPPGQPLISNWFRDFPANNPGEGIPEYATYGIGKWHVGYASSYNTPEYNGFDHYYGFYQSGIDYVDKTHPKATYWDSELSPQFDFFEDEVPAYPALNVTTNTMDLYLDKIDEYLTHFNNNHGDDNLFLYLGIQTLHGPLVRIAQYTTECRAIFNAAGVSSPENSRLRTCEFTRMSDDWMEAVKTALINHGLWDDTLLVVTGDNGADIEMGACNYPLRGTKSTMWDGNIRQLTFVNGGDNIIPSSQRGTTRSSLVSNLDWTPTLLSFAGILPFIDTADYEWDGVDQWEMIEMGDDYAPIDHLLISMQSDSIATVADVDSYSIIFKYEWTVQRTGAVKGDGKLYKYVLADVAGDDNNWVKMRNDGWCTYDGNGSMQIIDVAGSEYEGYAEIYKQQFLFNLDVDEGETHNLLNGYKKNGATISTGQQNKRIAFAEGLLEEEIAVSNNADFYSYPIACLWDYYEEGAPINFEYTSPVFGYYIMPFLSNAQYLADMEACINQTEEAGQPVPAALKDLYYNEWVVPLSLVNKNKDNKQLNIQSVESAVDVKKGYHFEMVVISIIAMMVICVSLTCAICYKSSAIKKEGLQTSNDEFTPLLF